LGWDKLGAATGGLVASHAPDLMIDNNVFLCGYVGVGLGSCPGAKVLNNTIVGEGNYGVTIVPDSKEETYTVRNNLFCRAILGYKVNACLSTYNLVPQLDADYNLYAIPDDHNGSIGMLSDLKHIHDMDAWRDAWECASRPPSPPAYSLSMLVVVQGSRISPAERQQQDMRLQRNTAADRRLPAGDKADQITVGRRDVCSSESGLQLHQHNSSACFRTLATASTISCMSCRGASSSSCGSQIASRQSWAVPGVATRL
jgi:hypothetical protein